MAMLSATAGSYKSFIAMAQACAVATGTPWLGQEVTERRKVVYVAAEGASGVRKRMVAWCMENGVDPAELKGWMYTLPMPIQLGDRYDVEDAIEMVQELDAAMLVLDTRARCTVGLEENSATEQSIAIETLESIRLAVPGALVYVIHHGGKGGNGPRGSSAWEGAVWSDMRGEGKDLVAKIYCAKHKDAESMCKHQIHLKQVVVPEEALPGWTVKQRTTLVVTGEVHHADSNDTPEAAEADRLGMSTVEYRERQKQAEKAAKAAEKRQAEQDDLHRAMETVSIALETMTERIGTAEHTGRALENEIEALAHEAEALTGKIAPKIGRPMRERALDRLIAEGHFEQSDGPRNSKPYRLVSPYRIPEQRSWGELAEIHMPEDDGSGTPPVETD
ncbi:AAA family ATPase [Rhodococcus hoagii]|nr:AAA family ATPase [Prescottella equi]